MEGLFPVYKRIWVNRGISVPMSWILKKCTKNLVFVTSAPKHPFTFNLLKPIATRVYRGNSANALFARKSYVDQWKRTFTRVRKQFHRRSFGWMYETTNSWPKRALIGSRSYCSKINLVSPTEQKEELGKRRLCWNPQLCGEKKIQIERKSIER